MRCRSNKVLAAVLAASMLLSQNGMMLAVQAEDDTSIVEEEVFEEDALLNSQDDGSGSEEETEAPQTEAPQTEAPQTEAPQTEAPQTEAPQTEAPQTEAPQTEAPQTEAPQTEAPQTEAPQTEAPATEAPQTEAPQTEAPATEAPQTEAPATEAPQTEASQTEAPQTEAPQTEAQTSESDPFADILEFPEDETWETETETESETEALTDSFICSGEGVSVSVQLTGGEMLPESTGLEVVWLDAARQGAGYSVLLAQELEQGHRKMAGLEMFRIRLMDGEEEVHPENDLAVSFFFDEPWDLGITPYMDGEAFLYEMDPSIELLDNPSLESDEEGKLWLYAATAEIPEGAVVAFAGVQNRSNSGEEIELENLKEDLGEYLDHPMLTNLLNSEAVQNTDLQDGAAVEAETEIHTYSGEDYSEDGESEPAAEEAQAGEEIPSDKGNEEEEELTDEDIRTMLEKLSEKSLELADAQSSEEITVINLYADEQGEISTDPVNAVLHEDGIDLDVTKRRILINIVADSEEQELEFPSFTVRDDDPERKEKLDETEAYARVLYNVTAWQNGKFVPYKGKASMKDFIAGAWIMPEAEVTIENVFLGAVYADEVTVKPEGFYQALTFRYTDEIEETSETEAAQIPAESDVVQEEEQEQADASRNEGAAEDYQKELVITSASGEWVYDGAAHTKAEYTVTFGGETISPDTEGGLEYTLPGTGDKLVIIAMEGKLPTVTNVTAEAVENTISYTLENDTSYALITTTPGTLTVTARPVTFTGESESKVYNGSEQTLTSAYTPGSGDNQGLVEGHTFTAEVSESAKGTDADTYTENPVITIFDAGGTDVTGNYAVTTVAGELTITERPVTITGNNESKVFTGEEQDFSEASKTAYTVSTGENEGFVEGHTVSITFSQSAKGTDAGSYTGTVDAGYSVTILDAGGNNVTTNYSILPEAGTLTIVPREKAVITVNSWLGADNSTAFTGAAVYTLCSDVNGTVLKDTSGTELPSQTNKTGSVSFTFDPVEYGLLNAVVAEKTEKKTVYIFVECPEGYYRRKKSAYYTVTVERNKNGAITVSRDGLFRFYEYLTDFTINVSAAVAKKDSSGNVVVSGYLPVVYTLKDEEGNTVTANDKNKTPLTITVTSSGVTTQVVDPAKYPALTKALESGGETVFTLEETDIPGGYYVNPEKQLILWKDQYGNVRVRRSTATKAASGNELNFIYYHKVLLTYALKVTAVDVEDKKTPLPGATYAIRLADGDPIKVRSLNSDGSVKSYYSVTTLGTSDSSLAHLAVIDLRINPELESILKEKGKAVLTISELTPPTETTDGKDADYRIYGTPDYTVTLSYDDTNGKLSFDTTTVRLLNVKKSSSTTNSDEIQVVKKLLHKDNNIYLTSANKTTYRYYMALFSDKKRTNRVSEVRPLIFVAKRNVFTMATTFDNLEPGTYYVGETDKYGNLVGTEKNKKKATDDFYVTYDLEAVEVSGTTNNTYTVTASNHYFKLPDNAAYFAELTVQKVLKDEKGAEKASSGEFWYCIYYENKDGDTVKSSARVISMNGSATGQDTIKIPMYSSSSTVRIRETDEEGKLLKSGDEYKITYSTENGAVTLSRSQTSTPVVTITNQKVEEKESEETADSASLTLTKKVTYKGNPMRVNAAYYIGIFKSSEISKANLLGTVKTSVRTLALRDASEASTKPIKVNLSKIKSHELTLYFAETDREGNPVKSGTTTGYNISINGQSGNYAAVTLNAKNTKAEVVVTNDILAGGVQEQRLLNSSTGFAGDTEALADAQRISNDASAGVASRTGDDTPILPIVGILGGSAAVILLAILILLKRRKK